MNQTKKEALLKAIKEFLRLVLLATPALAIQIISGDSNLTASYGGAILFVLRAVDKYIHENPAISSKGILPF